MKAAYTLLPVLLGLQTSLFAQTTTAPPGHAPILLVNQPLVIDGKADDWPIPATVFLSSAEGKAQMRFASDKEHFYALVEVEDESPLRNGADRPEEMFKGGDAVAFYFQTKTGDEQRVAVCRRNDRSEAYVYREKSEEKERYVFRSPVGEAPFDYVAPAKEMKVAFTKQEGSCYTLEICLNWRETLGYRRFRPEELTFDAQVVFSDPGGSQNAGAAWLFAREGPGLTIEDLPTEAKLYPSTWGRASFVDHIAPPAGTPALAIAKPEGGVTIPITLPRAGRLSLNIVDSSGWILRELVMARKVAAGAHQFHWDGRDRYGESVPPGTYGWKALLFDGMHAKFMGSVGNSGRPPYRTPDGLGAMGGQHGDTKSLACDEEGIVMANALQEGAPVMRKIDPLTGKALWARSAGSFKSVDAIAIAEGMACFINGLGRRGNYGCDLVRIDPETGRDVKMGNSARISLREAQGKGQVAAVAIAGGHAWIALPKKNSLLSVDLTKGEKGKSISLPAPRGLARVDERTLLVCSGSDVLRLDLASGATTPIITNLHEPRDVCLDATGRLYVSELGASQQIKQFSPDGTTLLATWGEKGGKTNQQIPYNPMAFRNVTNLVVGPEQHVWLAESDGLVKRFVKLNGGGDWVEDFYGPVAYNAFGPDLDDLSTVYYTVSEGCYIETKLNYAQYRKNPMDPARGWKIVNIHDLGLAADGNSRNRTMEAVAKQGYGHAIVFKGQSGQRYFFRLSKHNRAGAPIGAGLWIERNGRWIPCAFIARVTKEYASWADQNGDGLIQPDEEYRDLPVDQVSWIDRDLTLHGFHGRLSPASVSAAGVPRYDGGRFQAYLAKGEEDYIGDNWTFFSRAQDDTLYYISNHGPHLHLSFWDRATENRLIKVENGRVQWVVGKHAPRPQFVELSTNSGVAGAQDGVVLVQNIEPCNYVAFTEDGFVLGDIMVDENGRHPKVGPYVINIESFTGLYVKDPKTGKNVLFAVSSGDDRILEVTGPGETTRMKGTITLPCATPNRPLDLAIPYSTWYGYTNRGIGVDGEDAEWKPDVLAFSITNKDQVVADCRLRRDAGNLYLFASVTDRQMQDRDGVKLTLATSAAGKDRYEVLLPLSRNKDGLWACKPLLRKNGEMAAAGGMEAAVLPRWRGLGYRIEAEVPLSLLPEMSTMRAQTFRRPIEGNESKDPVTEKRLDLKGPVFIDIQVKGADTSGALATGNALRKATLDP